MKKEWEVYIIVGFLKNVLPQNFKFLDNLARVIKEEYYSPKLHSPEKSLKESLRQANEFLEKIAKSGDVSWLGNLSFTSLSLSKDVRFDSILSSSGLENWFSIVKLIFCLWS